MPNMNAKILKVRKLWQMLKSRSKVMVKVTFSNFMILSMGLVIRNAYAKYESFIC